MTSKYEIHMYRIHTLYRIFEFATGLVHSIAFHIQMHVFPSLCVHCVCVCVFASLHSFTCIVYFCCCSPIIPFACTQTNLDTFCYSGKTRLRDDFCCCCCCAQFYCSIWFASHCCCMCLLLFARVPIIPIKIII